MNLYWGTDSIILFSGWPNHSLGMYHLALFFVFFLAMVTEVMPNKPTIKRGTSPIKGGLILAAIYFIRISIIYLVMLAVMSFNLGIFIAAVVGHTLGFFISKYYAIKSVANREENQESSIDEHKV